MASFDCLQSFSFLRAGFPGPPTGERQHRKGKTMQKPSRMSRAEVKEGLFNRFTDHMRKAVELENDFAVETMQASAVLATIAANDWLEDYKAWQGRQS